ncbi:hypothetical protein E2C01_074461 [Portunus trituberculatus]|uniref:Uncharacterized protein n=1 Tax=Portunus trituberculatus TaxID=210409 RepID=A0A5B7ICF7_PORTR|nr:hypothetical protein [Portunus trituberculatus]
MPLNSNRTQNWPREKEGAGRKGCLDAVTVKVVAAGGQTRGGNLVANCIEKLAAKEPDEERRDKRRWEEKENGKN